MANISFTPQISAMERPAASEIQDRSKIAAAPQPAPGLGSETVKLSVAAQVKMMYHQGFSPSVIAAQMGISASQLSGYLPGSTPTAPAATVVPQPKPTASTGTSAPAGAASSAAAAAMLKG